MKKNYVLILSVMICFVRFANAQAQEKKSFGERIYFGGNFGLSFGSSYTEVDVSPLVGYKITEKLSAGIGITYIYYKISPYPNFTYETSIYGGDVFARYFFFENVFGHIETGALNLDVPAPFYPYTLSRQWIQNLLIGGGYRSQMGARSSFFIMLLYDVIDDVNSPYQNPIIRVGFGFGM